MCGITGIFGLNPQEEAWFHRRLQPMLNAIAHRGPNDEGRWVDGQVGLALGHRRLSILDLSIQGHQPMLSQGGPEEGRYVLAFVGEIYNHKALRHQLQKRGQQFRGNSDTETLLALICAVGLDRALEQVNGMFSLALWDRQNHELHLVRDRLGVKPLYYGIFKGQLLFGSELKALMAYPGFRMPLNPKALGHFFSLGYVPEGETIFQEIHKVRPGSYVTFNKHLQKTETVFWALKKSPGAPLQQHFPTMGAAYQAFNELFTDAVALRMEADVPVGSFLSGGIDSSLVTACMQAQSTQPVKTFSIGFAAPGYNEATFAKEVANHLKTDHHELILRAEQVPQLFDQLLGTFDEPFGDASMLPTYAVSQLAAKDVTVVLSGDGGDEALGGYNRHVFAHKHLGQVINLSPFKRAMVEFGLKAGAKIAGPLLPMMPSKWQTRWRPERFLKLARVVGAKTPAQYYALCTEIEPPPGLMDKALPGGGVTKLEEGCLVQALQMADLQTYLPGDILTKVDRATMAHSLEARSPFLDYRLVEFGLSLDVAHKIQGSQGKYLARRLLQDYLPARLFERPKTGFGLPLEAWLMRDLRPWVEDAIKASHGVPYLNAHGATALLSTLGATLSSALSAFIWRYMMWAAWWRRYGKYVSLN